MKKSVLLVIIALLSKISYADDFQTIFDRLYNNALTLPTPAEVQNVLSLAKTDGSFSDLNYADVSFAADLSVHLKRINTLASAYKNTGSSYYHDNAIKDKFFLGLDFWVTKNQTPGNWWYRHIAYPKAAWPGIILMSDLLKSQDPALYNKALSYLLWAYQQNNYMDGANGADKIVGAYPATVLKRDSVQMLKMRAQIIGLIQVQSKGEGIEADIMFGQHSGSGRQLYAATYGGEYIKSILSYLSVVNATAYTVTSKEIGLLEKLFMEAIQWIIYAKHMDPSQTGRQNSSTAGVSSWTTSLSNFVALNTPQKAKLQIVLERMQNGLTSVNPPLAGNRMYWRFDYMLQRGSNYYTSVRMTSKRTVGAEAGNGQGNNNYYGGAGVNYIYRTGNEYKDPYFTSFNYRQYPGITAEQDAAALPVPNWGAGGTNNHTFAGGVTNGKQGACGMILDKRGVTANKSWFYFDSEYIALGAGIKQTAGTASVYTTINQCAKYSAVDYMDDQTQKTLTTGSATLLKPKWVVQDQVGYFNLDNTSSFVVSAAIKSGLDIFTAAIDHGKNPAGKTYAYVVKPGITTAQAPAYFSNVPVQILQNSGSIQAVKHKTLGITQMIFYSKATLSVPGGYAIEAQSPCALMLREYADSMEISLANPQCESSNPASMVITINVKLTGVNSSWDGMKTTVTFNLPQGLYAGQTVTQKFKIINPTVIDDPRTDLGAIMVYPNPVHDNLYIDLSRNRTMRKADLAVYNITGGLIYKGNVTRDAGLSAIDLQDQPNGMYYLKVGNDAISKTYKVVVNH